MGISLLGIYESLQILNFGRLLAKAQIKGGRGLFEEYLKKM